MSQTYKMHLHDEPFKLILNGKKDVEMRLCKNGREYIKNNDIIVFSNDQGDQIEVLVTGVHKYKNFQELYDNFDKVRLGYSPEEVADPDDMLIYYDREDIVKFGVLAIEIKALNH